MGPQEKIFGNLGFEVRLTKFENSKALRICIIIL